jgi:hypothetical protein
MKPTVKSGETNVWYSSCSKWPVTWRCLLVTAVHVALEYAIRKVQVNQQGLKFNGAYQTLIYVKDVNFLKEEVNIIKKHTKFVSSQ